MSAISPDQARSMTQAAQCAGVLATPAAAFLKRWEGVHAIAENLAVMAQLSPEPYDGALAAFPERLEAEPAWQRALAQQGLDDLEAMMRPGLAALEVLRQRGAPTTAPALALWREFYNARRAIMAVTGS